MTGIAACSAVMPPRSASSARAMSNGSFFTCGADTSMAGTAWVFALLEG
jgi:hypothetical protein